MERHLPTLPSLALLAYLGGAGTAFGQAPQLTSDLRLELPVACRMGPACVVQHYVDLAPGVAARDHTCGPLTYDGHDGIDIRTLTYAQMRRGVEVVAAAPGLVLRIRDGMADVSVAKIGPEALDGKDAGNGVVVDHGNGWTTYYAHLKRGSIAVRPREPVEAGQLLGQIGLSGRTNFPHLHFILRHKGEVVDPFTAQALESGCKADGKSLWTDRALAALAYRPGGLLQSGFAGEIPQNPTLHEGASPSPATTKSPSLIAWMAAWGLRKGDRWAMRLLGPGRGTLAAGSGELEKDQGTWFHYLGRKKKLSAWPRGRYRAFFRVDRRVDGNITPIVEREQFIELK